MTHAEDVAYLAGVIDSDGWIAINKSHTTTRTSQFPRYAIRVALEQCEPEAAQLAASLFGGRVHRRTTWTTMVGRPSFHWELTGSGAEAALGELVPFLRIKKAQGQYALRFRGLVGDGRKFGGRGLDKARLLRFHEICEGFFLGMRGVIRLRKEGRELGT